MQKQLDLFFRKFSSLILPVYTRTRAGLEKFRISENFFFFVVILTIGIFSEVIVLLRKLLGKITESGGQGPASLP